MSRREGGYSPSAEGVFPFEERFFSAFGNELEALFDSSSGVVSASGAVKLTTASLVRLTETSYRRMRPCVELCAAALDTFCSNDGDDVGSLTEKEQRRQPLYLVGEHLLAPVFSHSRHQSQGAIVPDREQDNIIRHVVLAAESADAVSRFLQSIGGAEVSAAQPPPQKVLLRKRQRDGAQQQQTAPPCDGLAAAAAIQSAINAVFGVKASLLQCAAALSHISQLPRDLSTPPPSPFALVRGYVDRLMSRRTELLSDCEAPQVLAFQRCDRVGQLCGHAVGNWDDVKKGDRVAVTLHLASAFLRIFGGQRSCMPSWSRAVIGEGWYSTVNVKYWPKVLDQQRESGKASRDHLV